MNLFQFFSLVTQFEVLLGWLRDRGLLSWSRACELCVAGGPDDEVHRRHFACIEVKDASKGDSRILRCKYCFKKYSIRAKTFFSRSHLPLCIIMAIVYLRTHKLRVGQVLELLAGEIASNNTVIDWFNFCWDVCSQYLLTHPVILGGVGDLVEVDETKIGGKVNMPEGGVGDMWIYG